MDVVLDDENDRHAHDFGIVQDIALVLDVLDHRDQNAGRALPQENPVDVRDRVLGDKGFDLAIIIGEDDHGDVEPGVFDFMGQSRRVHVSHMKVRDDQVEARLGAHQSQRFRPARNMRDAGHVAEVKFERFADQQFVEAAVLAQDEGIVEAGYQENVLDPEGLQLFKTFEESFGVDRCFRGSCAHGRVHEEDAGWICPTPLLLTLGQRV